MLKVEVLGLADVDGPANHNLALSRRRADTVAHALAGSGLPAPAFDIEAVGEAGAKAEPLRRRTEVLIHETFPDQNWPNRWSWRLRQIRDGLGEGATTA